MPRFAAFCGLLVAFATLVVHTTSADEPKDKDKPKAKPNRLAKESSPYLLQHAHNPVDWYPWGPEAFERAKKEKKLIFLSIGYSSCHWCHVMERESFSNAEIAKMLNDNFVCIKVDREERPDIDDIYMTALNVTGRAGRLAAVDVPDGRRQADLRRHVLAARGQEGRRGHDSGVQDDPREGDRTGTRTSTTSS